MEFIFGLIKLFLFYGCLVAFFVINLMFRDKLYTFIYYKIKDIKNAIKHRGMPEMYGVWVYVGRPGSGKTISMIEYVRRQKRKYKDKIKVYSNFHNDLADGYIKSWHDLIDIKEDVPVIFMLDELQLTFSSRKWDKFPQQMVGLLTQNRKFGKGRRLLIATQDFSLIDKNFRVLTEYVVECRCIMRRWVFQRAFRPEEFAEGKESIKQKKKRHREWRYNFVQSDDIRNLYDTHQILSTMYKDNYLSSKVDN